MTTPGLRGCQLDLKDRWRGDDISEGLRSHVTHTPGLRGCQLDLKDRWRGDDISEGLRSHVTHTWFERRSAGLEGQVERR